MENRTGLMVVVETTVANGRAEREAAVRMLKHSARRAKSLGADKNYNTTDFVTTCRQLKVVPHVAAKRTGSALDGRTTLMRPTGSPCASASAAMRSSAG
jgi:hypothetical protein